MIRTQVYITKEQARDIKLQAKRERKREAEVIRELLSEGLKTAKGQRQESTGDSLLRLAAIGGRAPQIFQPGLTIICMEKSTDYPLVADTSALVSLATKTDHNHKPAVAAAENLRKMQRPIILPTDVLSETLNVLGKRSGRQTALQAAANLLHEKGQFVLLDTSAYISAALDKFTHLPSAVSFTDCLVMAVADHYHTRDIFGFDKQFADAGYRRLTPSPDWSSSA